MNARRKVPVALLAAAAPFAAAAPAHAGATKCDDQSVGGIGYEVCIQTIGSGLNVDYFQVKARAGAHSDPRDVQYRVVQLSNSNTARTFGWRTVSMNNAWTNNCSNRDPGVYYGSAACGTYPTTGWGLKVEWRVVNPGFWERNLRNTSGLTPEITVK